MKRFISALLVILILFSLSACSDNSDDSLNLSTKFLKYLKENLPSETTTIQTENLKLNTNEIDINLEKAEYNKKIIVTMASPYVDKQFFELSLEQLKKEMHDFAEHFISFAKEINLNNDYYLYVEICRTTDWGFVYDYEEDRLYYPENYNMLLEMHEKFGTANQYRISQETEGQNWLVENGFCEFKHHKYERYYISHHPWVYINEDGDFSSYWLNNYI